MRYTSNRKRKLVQSRKTTVDGIKFASGLEAYMYKCLKDANIKAEYEGEEFILIEGFYFDTDCYERTTTKNLPIEGGKESSRLNTPQTS